MLRDMVESVILLNEEAWTTTNQTHTHSVQAKCLQILPLLFIITEFKSTPYLDQNCKMWFSAINYSLQKDNCSQLKAWHEETYVKL